MAGKHVPFGCEIVSAEHNAGLHKIVDHKFEGELDDINPAERGKTKSGRRDSWRRGGRRGGKGRKKQTKEREGHTRHKTNKLHPASVTSSTGL